MLKIRAAVVALAMAVGFAVSGGAASAAPVEATTSDVGIQCTRQYVVISRATLRTSPGGPDLVYAIVGDKFNVPNPSGVWYEGNLYDSYNNFIGHGFLLASALTYTGICF